MTVQMTMDEYKTMEYKIGVLNNIVRQVKIYEQLDEVGYIDSEKIKQIVLDYVMGR